MLELNNEQINTYDKIVDVKLALHREFYPNYISELISDISNNIELFNIEVGENFEICLKIKKTSIKKFENYEHNSSYYYQILDNIILNFLMNHIFDIKNILSDKNLSDLINRDNINLFYSVTTLGDNIIYVYL